VTAPLPLRRLGGSAVLVTEVSFGGAAIGNLFTPVSDDDARAAVDAAWEAPSLLLEALNFIIDFHRDDTLLEFLEVRRILEPAATAMAALRMTDEDGAELAKLLDAVTVDDRAGFRQLRAGVAGRQHVDADGAGPGVAGHDRAARAGTHAGRAPGHPPGDRQQGRRPGPVMGDRPHLRHRVVAARNPHP
jgi:hypothetical protein